ncbi:hypothetical protein HOY80DRAFT_968792 [Tuber brumale]|nr:hypothetical protein HOY80DRAFT_968792 [Tuber brumale]
MNDPPTIDQYPHAMSSSGKTPLNGNLDARAMMRDGSTIGGPSPHPVMMLCPLSLQMLEEMDERWYQRLEKREKELKEDFYHRLLQSRQEWKQRWQQQYQQTVKKSCEVERLIGTALYEKDAYLMFVENFNLCGCLDRLVYHAQLLGRFRPDCPPSVLVRLHELAKIPEFQELLHHEVVAGQLTLGDVTPAITLSYNAASKYSQGNDVVITLHEDNYTAPVCAVLAAFLQLQSTWDVGFRWRRVKRSRITKH